MHKLDKLRPGVFASLFGAGVTLCLSFLTINHIQVVILSFLGLLVGWLQEKKDYILFLVIAFIILMVNFSFEVFSYQALVYLIPALFIVLVFKIKE